MGGLNMGGLNMGGLSYGWVRPSRLRDPMLGFSSTGNGKKNAVLRSIRSGQSHDAHSTSTYILSDSNQTAIVVKLANPFFCRLFT